MSLTPGEVIDSKYEIVRLLGEGGMGAVYEGLNVRIHRRVAIKVLHGNVAGSAEAIERFEREAQAAGRIGSSHIVEVLDLGELPGGERYMVMEFLEGQSLGDRVKASGKLAPQEIYPIAVQLLEGLAAAHAAGIVHRDLKPDNVYLVTSKRDGQKDFVKILDFGISKFNALGGEFSMTRTGAVMGTPYYMSPEQAKGARELDQRADLYAVGVILYECLSGRVPFQAQTFNELLFKIVLEEPPPLREIQANLDEGFIAIVAKAMSRDVSARYQTAAEFQQALHTWAHGGGLGLGGVTGATLPLGVARPVSPAPTGPLGSTPMPTTPGWSSATPSTPSPEAPPRKNRFPLIAAALVGVLAVGGAAAYVLSDGDQEAAAARADEERRAEEERLAQQQKLEEDKRRAEDALVAAEKALAEAQRTEAAAKPTDEPATDQAEPATAEPPPAPAPRAPVTKTASAKTTKTAPKTAPPASTSSAPPKAAPPATTTPSDKGTTSTGRTIRSTL